MKLTEIEKRRLLREACKDVQWPDATRIYVGNLKPLRDAAERLVELIDMIELDQWRAGNNPRSDNANN